MAFQVGHALVIGVGSYQHMPKKNVPITVADAKEVASVLCDSCFCGYPKQQVKLLHDAEATRHNIEAALDHIAQTLGEDDTFLLFYSGHGEYGEYGYYLTAFDTQMIEDKVVNGSGIHEKTLLEKLNAIKAKRVFLIFNACFAGEISSTSLGGESEPSGQNLPNRTASAILGTGEGRVIITACRENQKSRFLVKKLPLTFFAQALVDGLQGKGVENRKGYISIFDLYEYMFGAVSSTVKQWFGMLNYVQEPELTIQKGVGVLAVSLHRGQRATTDLDETDYPNSLGGAVREVDAAESQKNLQQILSGKVNIAGGGNVQDVQILEHGDYINASGSKGFINRPTGPVNVQYGNSTVFNTNGGDYAGRDIIKSSVSSFAEQSLITLQSICEEVTKQIERAEAVGLDDLADDLRGVEWDLKAALKAKVEGENDRKENKISNAIKALHALTIDYPQLQNLASHLKTLR